MKAKICLIPVMLYLRLFFNKYLYFIENRMNGYLLNKILLSLSCIFTITYEMKYDNIEYYILTAYMHLYLKLHVNFHIIMNI